MQWAGSTSLPVRLKGMIDNVVCNIRVPITNDGDILAARNSVSTSKLLESGSLIRKTHVNSIHARGQFAATRVTSFCA